MTEYVYTILYEQGSHPVPVFEDEVNGAEVLILRSRKNTPEKYESVLVDHRGFWWHWLRRILTYGVDIAEEFYSDKYLSRGNFYWRKDKRIDEEVSRLKEDYEMIKGDNLESLLTMLELVS